MTSIEIPVLKLGLAGFSAEHGAAIASAAAASRITQWECGPLTGADAWLVNGQCIQQLGGGRLRVAPANGERSVQLQLDATDRPVAFSVPLPPSLHGARTFDVTNAMSIIEAIGRFEFLLAARAAQYLFASQIVEQEQVLGTGAFEVRTKGQVIAVVDMRGDAAVLPSVRPANFEAAVWTRVERARLAIPANFSRTSLSELMWRYVCRSGRDLLPQRYRTGPIFFRRAPRVDPVLVEELHLLVMRELMIAPGTFEQLQQRIGARPDDLARAIAALYYVGAVTSTRARAAPTTSPDDLQKRAESHYGEPRGESMEVPDLRQLTAPAPVVLSS